MASLVKLAILVACSSMVGAQIQSGGGGGGRAHEAEPDTTKFVRAISRAHVDTRNIRPLLKRCHVFVGQISGAKGIAPVERPLAVLEKIDATLRDRPELSWPLNELTSAQGFVSACREHLELDDKSTGLALELSRKQQEQERRPGSLRELHWRWERDQGVAMMIIGTTALGGPTVSFIKAGSSPARAGLRFGDLLLKVNGIPTLGMPATTVVGQPGDEVTYLVKRAPFEQTIAIDKLTGGAPLAGITHKNGKINSVAFDSPAATAGIPLGSQVIAVNGKSAVGLSDHELQAKLDQSERRVELTLWPSAIFIQLTAQVNLNELHRENNKLAEEDQEQVQEEQAKQLKTI